jgi:hypothetical protein
MKASINIRGRASRPDLEEGGEEAAAQRAGKLGHASLDAIEGALEEPL